MIGRADIEERVREWGLRENEVMPILARILERVQDACGVNLKDQSPKLKTHVSGLYTEGRVYYRGPRNTPQVASVRLDLSAALEQFATIAEDMRSS